MLGDYYLPAITAILESLENTQGVEVFGEWQHQENLVNQLSCSLCSLVALASSSMELGKVALLIAPHWDLVQDSLTQAVKRISPEKTSSFLAASQTVENLGGESSKEEVVALVKLLAECANNY